jgi:hypothetical protein
MVDRPAISDRRCVRNACLPFNQKPSLGANAVKLIACQHARVLGDQTLQQVFRIVGLLAHLEELSVLNQEDIWQFTIPPHKSL